MSKFQNVDYRMVIVEQIEDGPFNKGILMNAAVKETVKIVIQELIQRNDSMKSKFRLYNLNLQLPFMHAFSTLRWFFEVLSNHVYQGC